MALNAAAAVSRYAQAQDDDPLAAHINSYGRRGMDSAQLAGQMALVSIAQDLRQIREDLQQLATEPS
jgi:hypothetical protein